MLRHRLPVAKYKAVPLTLLRARARERGVEAEVLSALSEDDAELYARFVATEWVATDFADRVYGVAAPIVYGQGLHSLRILGQESARADLGGVYRVVVRFLSVPSLLQRAADLWGRYHDTGHANAEQLSEGVASFVVTDHPSLGPHIRETISGWIAGAGELAGARNVRVVQHESARCHTWRLTWR